MLDPQSEMSKNDIPYTADLPCFAAYIGIDWADKEHHVAVRDARTGAVSSRVVKHTPSELNEWVNSLQTRYGGNPVAIGIEQSRGALIYALMAYDFLTIFPINPKSLASYRAAFAPSGPKNDPVDARLLAEIVHLHNDRLKAWKPDTEQTLLLGLLNEDRRKAINLRSKLIQRLRSTLKLSFPLALEILDERLSSKMAYDFLKKWPTFESIKRARSKTIETFFRVHNSRSESRIKSYLETIDNALPLTHDTAIIKSSLLNVSMIIEQLRVLENSIKTYEEHIAHIVAEHADASIFFSFPGAGHVYAPRILCVFGSDRDRFDSANSISTYIGIAPVEEQSGNHSWVHWRWACPKFQRQSLHEFAQCSIPHSIWAKAYFELQIERGKGRNAAIRALAFKWIRIIFRCWKDRIPYDEHRYLESLRQRNSPLWKRIEALNEAA
jgi:transposase